MVSLLVGWPTSRAGTPAVIRPKAATTIETTPMTTSTTNFAAYRDGYGGTICKRLGVDISGIGTWRDYTKTMVLFNAREGRLVDAARRLNRVASSSEVVVLHAALAAADFTWLADELGRNAWDRMSLLGGSAATAVAAAILRQD